MIEADTIVQNVNMFQRQFVDTIKRTNMEKEEQKSDFKKHVEAFDAKANEKIFPMETRLRQLDEVVGQLSRLISEWAPQGMQGRVPTLPIHPEPAGENGTKPSATEKKEMENDSGEPAPKKEKRDPITEFFNRKKKK